ncbi:MAG: tyrosine-type recombinase/integrase [Kofleriaceae bacterium]|nr:tyrosine-type recombinase/integrase [Kofleriaceae bacterium]
MPDGTRERVSGTPGVPGPYHDLAPSKVGAQEAERRAIARLMTGLSAKPAAQAARVPTIEEYRDTFLDAYSAAHKPSAQRAKKSILRHNLIPFFGPMRLDEIRQEDVDKLIATLLKRGLSRKTVNNVTAVLSTLLRYAVKNKVIPAFDLKFAIKAQSAEIHAVASDDVVRIVEACGDPRYRAAILLAADAGLRVGEIRALMWSDVNQLAREITISRSLDRTNVLTETKGWERRVVPISDRLWAALKALDDRRRYVLSRRAADGPMRYDVTRHNIHRIYTKAGVTPPPKPWHSLRHTFCTELARAGVPVNVIKELAGHKSIETTLRYMHTDRAAKRDAIDALRGNNQGSLRLQESGAPATDSQNSRSK